MSGKRLVLWFAVLTAGALAGALAGVVGAVILARTQPDNVLAGFALGGSGSILGGVLGFVLAFRLVGDPLDLP